MSSIPCMYTPASIAPLPRPVQENITGSLLQRVGEVFVEAISPQHPQQIVCISSEEIWRGFCTTWSRMVSADQCADPTRVEKA